MKIKHNKKRNVGIIYELLVLNMTKALLSNNQKKANKIKELIEGHFNSNTELFKEYRVFKALSKKDYGNDYHAISTLNEVKKDFNDINKRKLDYQKSKLIKDINYNFGKGFYFENVSNYKSLATIQLTLNEWNKKSLSNIDLTLDLEKKIIQEMTLKEDQEKTSLLKENNKKSESSKLVLDIMTKKINEKYTNMSKDQKEIIKRYALYSNDNQEKLIEHLKFHKNQALIFLENFKKTNDNQILSDKIENVKNNLTKLNENILNDSNIIKFLTVTNLVDELKKEE